MTLENKSYNLLKGLLSVGEVGDLDKVLCPLFKNKDLILSAQLKDYFMGPVSCLEELRTPQVDNPLRILNFLREKEFFKQLESLAQDYLKSSQVEVLGSHMLLKTARTGREIPWHQDLAYWEAPENIQAVTFLIPMGPTDESCGGLRYYRPSVTQLLPHNLVIPQKEGANALQLEIDLPDEQVDILRTSVGDVIMHFPKSIHSSFSNLSSNDRNLLVLIFFNPEDKAI